MSMKLKANLTNHKQNSRTRISVTFQAAVMARAISVGTLT